jgi:hypothetical protein
MSLSLISHLLQSYGYFAVFAFIALESLGIPLPGETTLIAAAVYAGATHHLRGPSHRPRPASMEPMEVITRGWRCPIPDTKTSPVECLIPSKCVSSSSACAEP